MKKTDLIAILENAEMTTDDKYKSIMAAYGQEINELKDQNKQIAPLQEQLEALKTENAALVEGAQKYADYDELKTFKETTVANEVKQQKLDFLTSKNCKHPGLLLDAIDWSKGQYDSENKTFTGLDDALKNVQEQYADLFVQEQPKQGSFSVLFSGTEHSGANEKPASSMNDFIRGL